MLTAAKKDTGRSVNFSDALASAIASGEPLSTGWGAYIDGLAGHVLREEIERTGARDKVLVEYGRAGKLVLRQAHFAKADKLLSVEGAMRRRALRQKNRMAPTKTLTACRQGFRKAISLLGETTQLRLRHVFAVGIRTPLVSAAMVGRCALVFQTNRPGFVPMCEVRPVWLECGKDRADLVIGEFELEHDDDRVYQLRMSEADRYDFLAPWGGHVEAVPADCPELLEEGLALYEAVEMAAVGNQPVADATEGPDLYVAGAADEYRPDFAALVVNQAADRMLSRVTMPEGGTEEERLEAAWRSLIVIDDATVYYPLDFLQKQEVNTKRIFMNMRLEEFGRPVWSGGVLHADFGLAKIRVM